MQTEYCLITRAGQGLGGLVDRSHPSAGSHDPLTVIHTAHIRLIDELGPSGKPGHHVAVHLRRFHLAEVSGDDAEGEHELGDILIGGKAKSGGGGVQHVVLLGVQVVVHGAVLAVQIGLEHDLVIALHVVGAGDDLIQPHRLGGQGITPVERGERGGGIVGNAAEIVSDLLAGHDLGVAGLLDGDVGVQALVGHRCLDDLAGVLDLHLDGGLVQAVELCGLGLNYLVPAQGQRLGNGNAVLIGADGIHQIARAVVVDLELGVGDGRTGGPAVHGVVVLGGLGDLDLSRDSGVLPGDLGGGSIGDIDGLQLGIHDVAVILQFPQVVAPGRGQVVDIDVPRVIAAVLPDGILIGVVQKIAIGNPPLLLPS